MSGSLSVKWYLVPAASVLAGLYFSVSEYFSQRAKNELISVPQIVLEELCPWLLWAALSPLIFMLVRRFPLERPVIFRRFLLHSFFAVLFAITCSSQHWLISYLSNPESGPSYFPFVAGLIPNAIIYWILLVVYLPFLYHERYQNELLKATRLDAQLSQARLHALTAQLHPHFLFNTLHSISALALMNETHGAVKMINRLSEFLRMTLENQGTQVVTLEQEIEVTRRYLEIELVRFEDRLAISWDVDPAVLRANVPNFILQPLVENAMRHVVDSNAGCSQVCIVAQLQDGRVLLEVRDDGRDLKKLSGQFGSAGLGLKNTRARLSELYGEDFSFRLCRMESDWTAARIVIPYCPAGVGSGGRAK